MYVNHRFSRSISMLCMLYLIALYRRNLWFSRGKPSFSMRSLLFREGLGVGSLLFHALFHCFTPQSFCRKNSEEGHKGYKGEWKGIKGSRDGFYSPSASRRKAEGLARTQAGVEPLLKNQESILKPRRGGRIILSGLRRLNTNVHYSQGLHPCLCSCQAFGLRCLTLKKLRIFFCFPLAYSYL